MISLKRTNWLRLVVALLFGVLAFSLHGLQVYANEITDNIYADFDSNTLILMESLDQYTTKKENGALVFDVDKAVAEQQSQEVIEVGEVLNLISRDIDNYGFHDGAEPVLRALFPIGSYGNYCGKGNKGWNKNPIDDLDSACREHDKCFQGFNAKSKACNRAFVRRLLPIVQTNSPLTYKGAYAAAALKLFSSNM
ncbi:hypothetical protein IGI65_002776 [Enterococcus sp. DIV0755b]|uniref:phospholipase A2 family protein n=1 Tax=Enterococcus sp. DIV0755b TaxID=2774657 RepID=UPI003F28804B